MPGEKGHGRATVRGLVWASGVVGEVSKEANQPEIDFGAKLYSVLRS